MKFLLQNNVISVCIRWFAMMFEIFFHHLIRNISRAPYSISYCPKMSAPISLPKFWKFFLQSPRCSSFQPLYQITHRFARRIFYMDMYMVFADYSFQYSNIFRIADLFYQITTSSLYFPLKNMVSVFCNPNYVCGQSGDTVTAIPLFAHPVNLQKCVATESLALKAHSFN